MPEAVVRGVRHALGRAPGLQDRRHLRGRVRRDDAVPLQHLRRGDRGRAARAAGRASSSAPARTGSGRASSSTTPACTPSFALRDAGYDTVMVNCNPETVSTDYDTSSRLYFEPLTLEDVLEVVHAESAGRPGRRRHRAARRPDPARAGQGAQGRGRADRRHLARRRSTSPRTAARSAGCWPRPTCPRPSTARRTAPPRRSRSPARSATRCWCGPSYVLGGRGMEIVYDDETLGGYVSGPPTPSPEHPVLVDRFLDDAIEIDVDALYDGTEMYLGGIMEHIEEAGIHSGDSACTLPPVTLGAERARAGARVARSSSPQGIGVRGPDERPVRPRPGHPLRARGQPAGVAHRAVRRQGDRRAAGQGRGPGHARRDHRRAARGGHAAAARRRRPMPAHAPVSVKEAVLPFKRFRTREGQVVDSLLGPEMRSTGEVMGIDTDFGPAFAKSQLGCGQRAAAQGHDLRLGRQPRQARDDLPGEAAGRPRLRP